tara:strand:+ start:262 stop:513 length:252 start_codon:yes stop_codon:yes gene_type:complete
MKRDIEKKWTDYAKERLVGKKITRVRYLTHEEAEHMDWYSRPLVLELSDGSLILPSCDDEGNNGGALFGQSKDFKDWTFPVIM